MDRLDDVFDEDVVTASDAGAAGGCGGGGGGAWVVPEATDVYGELPAPLNARTR
jgi:hypothetical protein